MSIAEIYVFDPDYYRAKYNNLAGLRAEEATRHFFASGINEGRIGGNGGLREDFVRRAPTNDPVLELGPFASPAIKGDNVRYANVLSTADLVERANRLGIDSSGCPEIHYVLTDFDLTKITDRFLAVFSSHCIEHQPDLVRHFQSIEKLLIDGGQHLLIIPDKRFCFDHFLAESSIADVLAAYIGQRKIHDVASVIEHRALTTHNDSARHWSGDHSEQRIVKAKDSLINALLEYEANPNSYIDVHAWQFTPIAFSSIVGLLTDLGLISLKLTEVHPTAWGRNEFCAVLQKAPLPDQQ